VGRSSIIVARLGAAGVVALVAGGTLLGTALTASAAPTPTITLATTTGISSPPPFADALSATGFDPKTWVAIMECNLTANEPTITYTPSTLVAGEYPPGTTFSNVPVGCGFVSAVKTDHGGNIGFEGASLTEGIPGPPSTGTDSAGTSAATDAQNYPCPPLQTNGAGASCAIDVFEAAPATKSAFEDVSFTTAFSTTTTTTTIPGCTAQAGSVTAPGSKGTSGQGTATVTPATCLSGGQVVSVTMSGLSEAKGTEASVLECNTDANQPTVVFAGATVPVSCTPVTQYLFSLSGGGGTEKFTVIRGTTGPAVNTTDSAGNASTVDALKYPCPPTPAQVTAGDGCVIAVGDLSGDELPVPISFSTTNLGTVQTAPNVPGKTSSTKSTTKAATKVASGSLAFTGTGSGTWIVGMIGAALIVLGIAALALVEMPRRLLLRHAGRPARLGRDGDSD